jgi:hypothetical protein
MPGTGALVGLLLVALAGLFWMLWHLLAARILWKYAKE